MKTKKKPANSPILAGWLEIPEAAKVAKLKPDTLRRYCHRRLIHAEKIGALLLVHRDELARFKRERRQPGRPKTPTC